jgi:DNA-nicking Smr family endonuclease
MAKKPDDKTEDKAAFLAAMQGVRPLTYSKKITPSTRIKPVLRKKEKYEDLEQHFPFSDYETLAPVSSNEILFFARGGIQNKILRNLRQGKYNAEAILDLHGKTSDEARISLNQFIVKCRKKGVRHVLIIHGKGRANKAPILKNKLNHWLRQTPDVLAFSSATNKDGATGALYVFLRRE